MKLMFTVILCATVLAAMFVVVPSASAQKQIIQRGDIPGVQLSSEQRQQIISLRQQGRREIRSIAANKNLTTEQKDDQIMAVVDKTHKAVMDQLTPAQREQAETWWSRRIEQPMMQRYRSGAGPGHRESFLFRVPGVPSSSLTDSQKNQIAQIRLNTMSKVDDINSNSSLSEDDKMQQIDQARMQGHQQVLDVLTPEQKQQYETWWTTSGK